MMSADEQLMMGWLSIALNLLDQVDPYTQTTEWRDDVERLRVRFYTRAQADK